MQYSETTTTLGAVMQNTCCDDNIQSDYFNIDDILAEEQTIPCTFLKDALGLAHLDQMHNAVASSSAQREAKARQAKKVLPKGKTIDLPAWLGVELSRRAFVEIKKPPFLT